jgi:hypothetical protein
VDYPDRRLDRLTSLFRIFTAIPIVIVLGTVSGEGWQSGTRGRSSISREMPNGSRNPSNLRDRFDPESTAEWIELLKDIAAMANSGGGVIVVGVMNDGAASKADVEPVLKIDPGVFTDKLFAYTGDHFSAFEVRRLRRNSRSVAAITVGGVDSPLVFTKPGTYALNQKDQKTAFSKGTVYFRHGAKSEPGTGTDLARVH